MIIFIRYSTEPYSMSDEKPKITRSEIYGERIPLSEGLNPKGVTSARTANGNEPKGSIGTANYNPRGITQSRQKDPPKENTNVNN